MSCSSSRWKTVGLLARLLVAREFEQVDQAGGLRQVLAVEVDVEAQLAHQHRDAQPGEVVDRQALEGVGVHLDEPALAAVGARVEDHRRHQQRQPDHAHVQELLVDALGAVPVDVLDEQAHVRATGSLAVDARPVAPQIALDAPVGLADEVVDVLVVVDEGHVALDGAVARVVGRGLEHQVALIAAPVVVEVLDQLRHGHEVGEDVAAVGGAHAGVLGRHVAQQRQHVREQLGGG
jgi:hypothetical protein